MVLKFAAIIQPLSLIGNLKTLFRILIFLVKRQKCSEKVRLGCLIDFVHCQKLNDIESISVI